MAARQDQGLLATLIVFVILFLLAFVAAYIGWKSYSDSQQQVAELENQLRSERDAKSNIQDENQNYRKWMGFGEFDNLPDVQKTVEQDMERFGASFDEASRSYRNILEYVDKENQSIAAREAAAKEQVKQLKDRLIATESEKDAQIVQAQNAMKKTEEDAASERRKFEQDRKHLQQVEHELQANLTKQRATYEAEIARLDATGKDLSTKLEKSDRAKQNLLAQVSKSSDSFEVADGHVSWVNPDGTVWINLGSNDSLRRQITFSVFDSAEHDAAKASKKGSIEVTRVLGEHLAEARVTDDDPRNPILSGDQIYSQVWHRGKKLRFALTGIMDVDDDSRSDLQLVRDLVDLNGGVVDSYLADDGKIEGDMSVNTRYLVLGKFPEQANQAALIKGWNDMIEEAKTLGVETITLDMFLNQVGYSPSERTVELGRGARSADFPAQPSGRSFMFRAR
jgi:CHASE3 domain sensor protein